jgi:hypothetical protein
MRAGYVALLSLVVAYSAYQGTSSTKPDAPRQKSGEDHVSVLGSLQAGAEPLPTIGGGICPLTLGEGSSSPCGDCKAICPAKRLAELIEDHFRTKLGSDQKYLAAHWNVPQAEQQNVKFVIASLPDPVHTHMALLFDRGIETMQSAAQASGYLFVRAWMPWDIASHSESSDFTVRMAQDKLTDQIESMPGLMIFERSSADGSSVSTLFVFVVGESPTGGIRTGQFQSALSIRERILASTDLHPSEASVLRIYGPRFSGSLRSLNAILQGQPHEKFSRILIRSGSVSSYRAIHEFCASVRAEWPSVESKTDPKVRQDPPGRPDLVTFQVSNEEEEYRLGAFLREREHEHSRIAILSEDETVFGNQEATSAPTAPAAQLADLDGSCSAEPPPTASVSFLRLYFPREIAQLRDAYQRNLKIQSPGDGSKSPPQNGLALSLNLTGNDDDSVAPYSPLQTPPSEEAVLQGIVATLRKNHARVVVIRASDPLDVVFLSRYLRQNFPQARLVTSGADLLMIHEFFDPRFHGILAITTYPLLHGAQFPERKQLTDNENQERFRIFPDSYSVGGFNAFESLLAPAAKDERKKLPEANYVQFGLPSFLDRVPGTGKSSAPWRAHLWLTTVGRDGYWPVAVLDEPTPAKYANEPARDLAIPAVDSDPPPTKRYLMHLSIGWTIFWLTALGLTLFLAFVLVYPQTFARSEVLGRFGGDPSKQRNCLLFIGSMLVLAMQTLFVFPAVVWLRPWGPLGPGSSLIGRLWGAFGSMGLVIACYVVSVTILGLACYKAFRVRESTTLARACAAACGALVGLTLLVTVGFGFAGVGTRLNAVVYRYIELGSGVSPCVPLLFLLGAWVWWCWQTLTGIVSTEEKHMVLPDADDFDRDRKPPQSPQKVLLTATDRVRFKALAAKKEGWPWKNLGPMPFGERKEIVGVAAIEFLVICVLMWPWEIAEAFESFTYKFIYWILLYSCLFLVCFLVTHIVALWIDLRAFLQAVDRVRFRRGFCDLKSLTQQPLWKLASSGREEFIEVLSGELDALPKLNKEDAEQSGLAGAIQKAKAAVETLSAHYENVLNGYPSPDTAKNVRKSFYDLQRELAETAREALLFANGRWQQGEYVPPKNQDFAKDSAVKELVVDTPAGDRILRCVERFLCLFYLNVILVPLRRLQTLILALAGVFVFVLISYSSYPFESRESFHVLLIAIFFAISLVVGVVYGQMYTNSLLSRITSTRPGELGLDFWVRLGTFVFIPLLSLLSVQFPEINNFLFSWLQPALQSVK